MTVAELIERLQSCPSNSNVHILLYIPETDCWEHEGISDVEERALLHENYGSKTGNETVVVLS